MIWDVLVIGAGPAGLAAAYAARKRGAEWVLILERDDAPGGILQQCIHNGFGLHRFNEELTGPEYAARWFQMVNEVGVDIRFQTMAMKTSVTSSPILVWTMSPVYGHVVYETKTLVYAMGCRERPRGALLTPGTRPLGIYTAGTIQRLVNIDGIMPAKRVVILGSGDIGLIMARRLTYQGAKVLACVEIQKKSSGLIRNVVQCLDDYDIPLLLSHTVTEIEGSPRLTGVKVSKVDDNLKPIPETERHYDCDTLVLSCGLIPERELITETGLGVFEAGNVRKVYDLVDWVSRDAEIAGREAAEHALNLH